MDKLSICFDLLLVISTPDGDQPFSMWLAKTRAEISDL